MGDCIPTSLRAINDDGTRMVASLNSDQSLLSLLLPERQMPLEDAGNGHFPPKEKLPCLTDTLSF